MEKRNQSLNVIKINNRRYMGNKYKLLPFIRETVDNHCQNIKSFADVFAGTGSVSSAFLDKEIITNDNMYSNYICHVAWFGFSKYDEKKIKDYLTYYNKEQVFEDNYMSLNFSNTYFSQEDCKKIGFIREHIENEYKNKYINFREYALLLTSLLYAMDKIANTCGHYDGYRKGVDFNKHLNLALPIPNTNNNPLNKFYNEDANEFVKHIEADLVYLDPPYNSRQYCDSYHLLENVARWEKPEVFGVAKKMKRNNLKSKYCINEAPNTFQDLIQNIHTKYILLSYNNMESKGDNRSNAKIADEDIMKILWNKGIVSVFSQHYKAYTTGNSKRDDNQERLFLCECYK